MFVIVVLAVTLLCCYGYCSVHMYVQFVGVVYDGVIPVFMMSYCYGDVVFVHLIVVDCVVLVLLSLCHRIVLSQLRCR